MNNNLTLDDIYFKDAFTQTGNKLNLEVDNAELESISSKNNKFSLDCNGNLVVNSITTNSNNPSPLTFDSIYPVGSIYMSVSATNPSTLFGGTWTQLKDRFLLGAGDTYSNNTTGGESTHTLTTDEIPSHSHKQRYTTTDFGQEGTTGNWTFPRATGSTAAYTYAAGGGQAHNNMPPYLTVYMWKRTA